MTPSPQAAPDSAAVLEELLSRGIAEITRQLECSDAYARDDKRKDEFLPSVWELQNGHLRDQVARLNTALTTALSRLAPPAPVAAGEWPAEVVRPLVWRDLSHVGEVLWESQNCYGGQPWTVTHDAGCVWPWVLRPFVEAGSNFETLENAKAAAEAEHTRRVLALLGPHPVAPPGTPDQVAEDVRRLTQQMRDLSAASAVAIREAEARGIAKGREEAARLLGTDAALHERFASHTFRPTSVRQLDQLMASSLRRLETGVRALSPSAPVAQDGGWRPIATAPRDGSKILIWADGEVIESWWMKDCECWARAAASQLGAPAPTHWQPLPAPPAGDDV